MGVHGATDQIMRSDEIEHIQGGVVIDCILKPFHEPVMSRQDDIWSRQLTWQLTGAAAALVFSDII